MNNRRGLSFDQVLRRQKKYGPNKILSRPAFSELRIFLNQFKNILIFILLIASLVTFYLGDFIDAAVISLSILVMVIIGYSQEKRVDKILRSLERKLKSRAIVIRDGLQKEIDMEDITIGDLVILEGGNKVPADGKIVRSNGLNVNESILTGEWEPIDKKSGEMIYAGSLIENGWGEMIVTAIGRKTKMGQVCSQIRGIDRRPTAYQKKINALGKIIGGVVLLLCFYLFITGVITGRDPLQIFILTVAVGVGAIPEGLPIAITVALALGAKRILRNKGLIKRLPAVETLGSASVICTDKTGTLTTGEMRVAGIYDDRKEVEKLFALKIAVLNVNAFVENFDQPMEKWIIRGRPTEKALLLAGLELGLTREKLIKDEPIILEIPFNSAYKYSIVVCRISPRKAAVYYLGDPGKLLKIDLKNKKKKWEKKYNDLTSKGLRVLGVGYRKINISELGRVKNAQGIKIFNSRQRKKIEQLLDGGKMLSFIALHDPLRSSSVKAIKKCQEIGVRPVIITGDNLLTAQAIAKKIGLDDSKKSLTGLEWSNLDGEERKNTVSSINIFAQVDPIQKLEIISAFQENGETVTMTGDGINDVPALKEADVGIAVASAADAAKETSDLVLLNNSFKIIVKAIKEGRIIIENIRKIIAFLGSECFTEIILVSFSIIGNLPSPILPAQILWENLFEGSLQGVALAYEKSDQETILKRGRFDDQSLLTPKLKSFIFIFGISTDIILFGLYLFLYFFSDYSIAHLRTIIFACIVFNSLFYLFSCKNLSKNIWKINLFDNPYLIITWLIGAIGVIIAIYWPGLQFLLKTVSLNSFDWIIILIYSLFSLGLFELIKWINIQKEKLF